MKTKRSNFLKRLYKTIGFITHINNLRAPKAHITHLDNSPPPGLPQGKYYHVSQKKHQEYNRTQNK